MERGAFNISEQHQRVAAERSDQLLGSISWSCTSVHTLSQAGRQAHPTEGDHSYQVTTQTHQVTSQSEERPTRTMAHDLKLQPYQKEPDDLDRWSSQDRSLAVLLEQALRIKEEVAAGLWSNRGSIQAEALSRKLLENHVVTITHIVKQLSSNMQVLERQFVQRDSITSGTTKAVQSLDQKNMAGIGDLRGRVARCDASIAKLSSDVSSGELQVIRLQKDVAELRAAVDAQFKQLEAKLHHDVGSLEASLAKHSQREQSSMSDLETQFKRAEDRTSGEIKEVKEQTDVLRKWTEQQFNTHIQALAQSSQQLRSLLQSKTLEAETRLSERLLALEARVEQFETRRHRADRSQSDGLKRCEAKLSERMSSVESGLQRQLQLLKQEYHKGFLSVHDAIGALRQICDIKSHLDMEKLQKDIKHICRKVSEQSDTD